VANITFDKKEIERAKSKQGIYALLNRPTLSIESIEVAFKKYARAHGCKVSQLDTEWKRFQKILNQTLRSE